MVISFFSFVYILNKVSLSHLLFLSRGQVHELHQAVRDLSSDQLRLGKELNQEIENRNRLEFDTNRKYHDLNESISRAPSKSTNESSQVSVTDDGVVDSSRYLGLE